MSQCMGLLLLSLLLLAVAVAQKHSWRLTPFVDELVVPRVRTVSASSSSSRAPAPLTLEARPGWARLHSELPRDTRIWGYDGAFPGPTIVVARDQAINITWVNALPPGDHALPVDTCVHGPSFAGNGAYIVPHLHGALHARPMYDGQPTLAFGPGQRRSYLYGNHHPRGATLWVHDHALGITRLNTLMGLAAFWIVRDPDEDALGLPSGPYDVPLMISDVSLTGDAQIYVPPHFTQVAFYELTMVNGRITPHMRVKRGKYRLRLLNASGYRVYNLTLDNVPFFFIVATDGGLVEAPLRVRNVLLYSGERVEVLVDFADAAPTVRLMSDFAPEGRPPVSVMQFRVDSGDAAAGFTGPVPSALRAALVDELASPVRATRDFVLHTLDERQPCGHPVWAINYKGWDDLTEFVEAGTSEVWRFINPGQIDHPMHLHGNYFRVLYRELTATSERLPPRPEESGWKDTVGVAPGEAVSVRVRFPRYAGRYAYHCHLLTHEDDSMMRQYSVINSVAHCNANGVCDACEDCVSCPSDCAVRSGARCGNGVCEVGDGETCRTCAADCPGGGGGGFCCGEGELSVCNNVTRLRCPHCRGMPVLRACCGDGLCEGAETVENCVRDCDARFAALSVCGDCVCDYHLGESSLSCAVDCPVRLAGRIVGASVTAVLIGVAVLGGALVVGLVGYIWVLRPRSQQQ